MKIVTADITGSLIVNNVDVTQTVQSSSIWSGSIAERVTNLESWSSSLDTTYATDAQVSASILVLSQSVQASQAALSSSYTTTSGSFVTTSGSYAASSASLSTRVTNVEATASVNTQASASFAAQSASLSTRLTTDETNYTTTSGSNSSRLNALETAGFTTTGSNTFDGTQNINNTTNANGFNSVAALYTAGGFSVGKDSYVSGTAYFNNIVVYGTSSVQYTTSSQVNVGASIINLNTQNPAVRYGGIAVADSGSNAGVTGSMLWDSQNNRWIYSNPSGSSYDGGMLISGPRNSIGLGSEQGTLSNYITKGQGDDHITSSQITDDGTTVQIPGNLRVTGSFSAANLTGSLDGSNLIAASVANSKLANSTISGISLGSNLSTLTIGTGLSGTSYNGSTGVTIANSGVTSITAGTGISRDVSTGGVTITNSGVTSIVAGTNISISGGTGAVTITNGITNNNQLTNGAGYITSAGSISGNAGTVTNGVYTNANNTLTAGNKITIQNAQDGGSSRGLFMWTSGDTNWGIYMATSGAGKALSDGTAPAGLDGRTDHAIRFRVATSTTQIGFLWENSSNTALMQLQPNTGNLYVLADVIAYASSDRKLKDNICTISNPIEKIKKIGGYSFNWNDNQETYKGKDYGVIAQEIEEILPEIVQTRDNGYKAVKYEKLVPLLIEAIKEQQKQIEELKSLINGNTK